MTALLWHLGILAAAAALAVVIVRRIPVIPPKPPVPPRAAAAAESADRAFAQARWWEHRLASTRDDLPRFRSLVQRRLAELAVERLRRRHGAIGPGRAAEILGGELYELITVPVTAVPTRVELARLIARIEEI
ncbi:hypothetical protein [Streptosporangium roseum]|uniref:hypothetical protein n=1 Tax=Streptosporangium roseum TaxID=2001 RepID=UPI0004CD0126|nr:hypothetical protein [Streptosporangium roseum]